MSIDVLVCRADGSQTMERHTVPEDWFEVSSVLLNLSEKE